VHGGSECLGKLISLVGDQGWDLDARLIDERLHMVPEKATKPTPCGYSAHLEDPAITSGSEDFVALGIFDGKEPSEHGRIQDDTLTEIATRLDAIAHFEPLCDR
jgi:hypothetical protein